MIAPGLLPARQTGRSEKPCKRATAVGMVGDGIRRCARPGARGRGRMGAGHRHRLEVADVALMDDDPRKLARFIRSRRRQYAPCAVAEHYLALGLNMVVFRFTLSGHGSLWLAVFADNNGASLLVRAMACGCCAPVKRGSHKPPASLPDLFAVHLCTVCGRAPHGD